MAMLLGAILMLAADTIARAVNFPSEVPAGAVLALIGAPAVSYTHLVLAGILYYPTNGYGAVIALIAALICLLYTSRCV